MGQLTFSWYYVDRCSGEAVERFLQSVPLFSHTGQSLVNTIIKTLQDCNRNIKHCRGQAYDNASNMSGKYKGMQIRIHNISPLAEYVHVLLIL